MAGITGFQSSDTRFDHGETIGRLMDVLERDGLTVFAHVDHEAGATKSGLELGPTDLFLVGNPQSGTALMQANQTAGIDLPLHILIWTDQKNQTHIGFDDPRWIVSRHGIEAEAGDRAAALYMKLCEIVAAVAK